MGRNTKWVDRAKDGREFVGVDWWHATSNLDVRPRDDLFTAMPPLGATKTLFAFATGCATEDDKKDKSKDISCSST